MAGASGGGKGSFLNVIAFPTASTNLRSVEIRSSIHIPHFATQDSKLTAVGGNSLWTMPVDIRPPTVHLPPPRSTPEAILTHDADLPGRPSACELRRETRRDDSRIDMQRHSRRLIPTLNNAGVVSKQGDLGRRCPAPSHDASNTPSAVSYIRLRSGVGYLLYLGGYSHDLLVSCFEISLLSTALSLRSLAVSLFTPDGGCAYITCTVFCNDIAPHCSASWTPPRC
jgi:hypothetical protein